MSLTPGNRESSQKKLSLSPQCSDPQMPTAILSGQTYILTACQEPCPLGPFIHLPQLPPLTHSAMDECGDTVRTAHPRVHTYDSLKQGPLHIPPSRPFGGWRTLSSERTEAPGHSIRTKAKSCSLLFPFLPR